MNDKIDFKKLTNKLTKEAYKIRIDNDSPITFSIIWIHAKEEAIFYLTTVKQDGFYFT